MCNNCSFLLLLWFSESRGSLVWVCSSWRVSLCSCLLFWRWLSTVGSKTGWNVCFKFYHFRNVNLKKKIKYKTWICSNTTSSKRCGAAVTHKENLKPFFTIHCGQLTCMLCISYYLWFHPVFLHSSSPCLCCTESSSTWESPPSMECRYILKVPYCRYVELRTMSRMEFFSFIVGIKTHIAVFNYIGAFKNLLVDDALTITDVFQSWCNSKVLIVVKSDTQPLSDFPDRKQNNLPVLCVLLCWCARHTDPCVSRAASLSCSSWIVSSCCWCRPSTSLTWCTCGTSPSGRSTSSPSSRSCAWRCSGSSSPPWRPSFSLSWWETRERHDYTKSL